MSMSNQQLNKLRSGNTVWRTLIQATSASEGRVRVTPVQLCGKKVQIVFKGTYRPLRIMSTKGEKSYGWNEAYFLDDLHGSGCFDSYAKAMRFVKEVDQGLHPKLVSQHYSEQERY